MSGEGFQRKVALLRDSWAERRQMKHLAGHHDFDSQFALLCTLYRWAEAATADIRAVYGRELPLALSAAPRPAGPAAPAFAVTVGHRHTVSFMLEGRPRADGVQWALVVKTGADGDLVAAGPDRRTGHWTRSRLEETLLTVLGAYERSKSQSEASGAEEVGG